MVALRILDNDASMTRIARVTSTLSQSILGWRMDGEPHLIVILEDDSGLRSAIERLFRLSGFKTRSFRSAEELGAADCASSARCLIVDVQLPGTSGPAFYGTLQLPRPPAVFITAYDEPATRRPVEGSGVHALLTKPFLGAALLGAVNEAMQGGD
ncbi:response regulator [Paraburkholderia unamae]|uniref:Response regulator receiver domain-containing protein n=1 Tax=Paraburkholderia unamae TaxID=219649 RepID=A0ABX5KBI9_9BURK|nr:response regulator [Paraburkholderia unamae]PVX60003.1 response regulator receiver domain-containing protein [Paraburkholderia unamae]